MPKRDNLKLAEIVAEKMEDLNLLGEYTMYEFLGKTLIAFEQGNSYFINSEILEPLYNIDDKTDFEREIIYEVEERLPMSDEQQVVYDIIDRFTTNENPLSFLADLIDKTDEVAKSHLEMSIVALVLKNFYDFINNHKDIEFINNKFVEV